MNGQKLAKFAKLKTRKNLALYGIGMVCEPYTTGKYCEQMLHTSLTFIPVRLWVGQALFVVIITPQNHTDTARK